MVRFLRHWSVCTCILCLHLYCKGCIGGLGYVTQTQILAKGCYEWQIAEQVRTDYRFSLLTHSFSCSVLSSHIASPSVTPPVTFISFFLYLVSSIDVFCHHCVNVSETSYHLTLLHWQIWYQPVLTEMDRWHWSPVRSLNHICYFNTEV